MSNNKRYKQRITAILLCFFLGLIGAHKFYLNQNKKGLAILMLSITGAGLVVSTIWVFLNFLMLALMSDEKFDRKFN